MIRKTLAGAGAFMTLGVALFMPAVASAGEPVPFATASAPCSAGSISFPAQAATHRDVILHFKSLGGEGQLGPFGPSFGPGDEGWSSYGEIEAGTAPELTIECSLGSVEASLADRPTTPSTFSGVTSAGNYIWTLPFTAVGAGQYVIDLAISQGALSIENVPGILQSSGEYSLGSLSAGEHEFSLRAEPGPPAIWGATVRELPVAVNKLAFGQVCMAPGTGVPATFSVTGDTTITARVNNASGQIVRELGTFGVKEGNSLIPWDGRGAGGVNLPNGAYALSLTSVDPQGDSTIAQTTIYVASSGPSVSMTSPQSVIPSQSVAFQVADAGCGVASASVSIDGEAVGTYGKTAGGFAEEGRSLPSNGALLFSPRTSWKLGRHTWKIEATDRAGNVRTATGGFAVVSSLDRGRRQCVVPRVASRKLAVAKKKIRAAGCTVGRVVLRHRRGMRRGHVISSRPTVGSKKPLHGKVTLVVAGRSPG